MKYKKILSILLSLIIISFSSLTVMAHSGRTDANGGHRDNKNKSGLGYYHYHCGGYPAHLHENGVCPYANIINSYNETSNQSSTSTPKTIYASSVEIANMPNTINVGETTSLKASVYPSNAVDKNILWKSDNTSVATVNQSGFLHAVGVGTANIIATTAYGAKSTFVVTVNEVIAESISINKKPESILIDEHIYLTATILPKNTSYKDIKWTTDDENIAEFSGNKLIAKNVGKVTVTAIQKDVTDSFVLEVKPIEAKEIEIIFLSEEYDDVSQQEEYKLKKDESIELKSVITPDNTTDKSVKWSVNDETIAIIDENGVLTGIGTGIVKVTATTSNGIEAQIQVKIYSNTIKIIAVSVIVGVLVVGIFEMVHIIRKKKQLKNL